MDGEAAFAGSGVINFRIARYWSVRNPLATRTTHYQPCRRIYLTKSAKFGDLYECSESGLVGLTEDAPLNVQGACWLQMDGYSARCERNVRQKLNPRYYERWLDR